MFTAILIDIDNTLLDFDKCSEWAVATALAEHGCFVDESFFSLFKTVNDSLWNMLERREISADYLYKTRFNRIFSAAGIADIDGTVIEKRFGELMCESAQTVAGAEELLLYLQSKYAVFAVSNAAQNQQESRLKKSGLDKYIDALFTSELLGSAKPERDFFEKCFLRIGKALSKEEVLIIGDSLSADIKGGREFGIKTCWLNRNGNEHCCAECDFEVKKLIEIKAFL